ncbi:MAG: hypothetical protein WBV94_30695 [Blastocatellia bacterium]
MAKRVLWLDNDTNFLTPYAEELTDNDFEIQISKSVAEAESLLNESDYDLLILDVMIPTLNDDEEKIYPVKETEYGHKTGLCFYKRMKKVLDEKKTVVIVRTVRLDQQIKDEFRQAGLPKENFVTKFALRRTEDFLEKVNSILGSKS